MRNLILVFIRYHAFFLFLGLELLSFSLIFQNNKFQRANFINSSNYMSGVLYETRTNVMDYLSLKRKNEVLAIENASLRTSSPNIGKETINQFFHSDSATAANYEYLAAKVINNSIRKANNYLTLNKGTLDGVEIGKGVISSKGIVGIVKDVSPHFCTVMSILHQNSKVSVKIRSSSELGSFSWIGPDPQEGRLSDIPKHVKLRRGGRVVTSGYSSFFPKNVPVGTIQNYELEEGSNFYDISLSLATDFGSLDYVYIVNYILKEEQLELEADQAEADDE